jgi:hypothetical protein
VIPKYFQNCTRYFLSLFLPRKWLLTVCSHTLSISLEFQPYFTLKQNSNEFKTPITVKHYYAYLHHTTGSPLWRHPSPNKRITYLTKLKTTSIYLKWHTPGFKWHPILKSFELGTHIIITSVYRWYNVMVFTFYKVFSRRPDNTHARDAISFISLTFNGLSVKCPFHTHMLWTI